MKLTQDRLALWSWGLHAAGGAVTLALLAAAHLLVSRPLQQEAAVLASDRGAADRLIAMGEEIRAEHALLRRRSDETQDEIRTVVERIPETARESDFLTQLTALADRVGLHLRDYRPGAVRRHAEYSERTIDLTAHGDYAGICRFLDGLNDLSRLSTTVRMQVESDGDSGLYPLTMTVKIFFAPAETQLTQSGPRDRG